MDAETIATSIAAIATAASAIIIAWQAIETRKSAQAAHRAATASEQALAVANKSLAINQRQSYQGQFTALEAMRARLDDLGPSVWAGLTEDKPLGYVIGDSSAESEYAAIEIGTVLQVPQQQEQWLYAVYRIRIINTGTAPVTLTAGPGLFGGFASGQLYDRHETLHLAAGKAVTPYIAVGTRIEHWVYGAENDRSGYQICGEGGWGTVLETEKGVALWQSIKVRGSIIYSHGLGKWELKGVGTDPNYKSYLDVRKIERTYFSGDERRLPDLDPQPSEESTP